MQSDINLILTDSGIYTTVHGTLGETALKNALAAAGAPTSTSAGSASTIAPPSPSTPPTPLFPAQSDNIEHDCYRRSTHATVFAQFMDALPLDAHHVDGVHVYLNATSSKLDKLMVRQHILCSQNWIAFNLSIASISAQMLPMMKRARMQLLVSTTGDVPLIFHLALERLCHIIFSLAC